MRDTCLTLVGTLILLPVYVIQFLTLVGTVAARLRDNFKTLVGTLVSRLRDKF